MSRYLTAFATLLVAPALAIAAPASGPAISKLAAKKAALAGINGQIVKSKMETENGQPIYVFYIAAPNQPVQKVRVSGTTGLRL